MKRLSNIVMGMMVLFASNSVVAQVRLKIEQQSDKKTYVVSAVPDRTYAFPREISGTVQVTVRVPRGSDFVASELTTLVGNVEFVRNNVLEEESISPKYNYYTFGILDPLAKNVVFTKGESVKLFSFANASGAKVELIDDKDEILPLAAKQLHLDLGNTLAIATTMGVSNAYSGNVENAVTAETIQTQFSISKIYPNPASNRVRVTWTNNLETSIQQLDLVVVNMNGTIRTTKALSTEKGTHSVEVELTNYEEGTYVVKLRQDNSSFSKGTELYVIN